MSLKFGAILEIKVIKKCYILCGPSMMDYPETSGNLRKLAAEVSGRFLDIFINKKNFENKSTLIKKFRNLAETSAAGFWRFKEGFRIIHHWRTTRKTSCSPKKNWDLTLKIDFENQMIIFKSHYAATSTWKKNVDRQKKNTKDSFWPGNFVFLY